MAGERVPRSEGGPRAADGAQERWAHCTRVFPGSLCERGAGLSTPTGTWSPQNAPASPGSVRCPSAPGSLGEDTPSPVSLAGYSAQLILLNRGRMCVCINLAIITDFECGIQWNSRHSRCPAATTGSRTFSPPHPRRETPPGTERLPFLVPSLCSRPGQGSPRTRGVRDLWRLRPHSAWLLPGSSLAAGVGPRPPAWLSDVPPSVPMSAEGRLVIVNNGASPWASHAPESPGSSRATWQFLVCCEKPWPLLRGTVPGNGRE